MERIRVQYCGLSVRVGADDPAHLAWLAEFLSPHFEIGRYGPAERTLILGYTALSEDLIRRGVALLAASLEAPAGAAAAPIAAPHDPAWR